MWDFAFMLKLSNGPHLNFCRVKRALKQRKLKNLKTCNDVFPVTFNYIAVRSSEWSQGAREREFLPWLTQITGINFFTQWWYILGLRSLCHNWCSFIRSRSMFYQFRKRQQCSARDACENAAWENQSDTRPQAWAKFWGSRCVNWWLHVVLM